MPCEEEDLSSHPDLKSQHVSKDVASCDPNPILTECRVLREMFQPGRELCHPYGVVKMLEKLDQSLKIKYFQADSCALAIITEKFEGCDVVFTVYHLF